MNLKRWIVYLGIFATLFMVGGYAIYTYSYPSFQKTETGLLYSVVQRGAGLRPQEGEIMLLNASYKTSKGKVLLSTEDEGKPVAVPYVKKEFKQDGSVMEAVGMLGKDDKLIFKVDGAKVFGETWPIIVQQHNLKEASQLLLHFHLQNIMTKDEHKKWEQEQTIMLAQKKKEEAEKQLQIDKKLIVDYLEKHQITAQTTASGLSYVVDKPGTGEFPKFGKKVKVNYTGKLLNGKVFDTSIESTAKQHSIHTPHRSYGPLEFDLGVGDVIPGWDEGIALLQQGCKARFFIPSALAYGKGGAGALIPSNAVLIFEVELVDIQR